MEIGTVERTEMSARIIDWLSEENLTKAIGKTRDEIFEEFGNELKPIAYIPQQYLSLLNPNLTDSRIYCGKGDFIDHAIRNHGANGHQASIDNIDVGKYLNIQSVLDNPDHIKETNVDGKRTLVFIKKIGRYFAELTQIEEDGKIVLHKTLFNQKKEPYAKLNDIRQKKSSSEGGTSSISHADESAPAISLESRDDVDHKGTNNPPNNQTQTAENLKPDDNPAPEGSTTPPSAPEPPVDNRERVRKWLDEGKGRWRLFFSAQYAAKELGIPEEEVQAIIKELKEERQAKRNALKQPPAAKDKPTKKEAEKTVNGYKIGDEVMFDRLGKGNWEKYKIVDFDAQGRPLLDSFGSSIISEVADWNHIKPVEKKQPETPSEPEKSVPLQPEGPTAGPGKDEPLKPENNEKTDLQPGAPSAQRDGGHQLQPHVPLGTGKRDKAEQPQSPGVAGRGGDNPMPDAPGSGTVPGIPAKPGLTEPALPQTPMPAAAARPAKPQNRRNNSVPRGTDVAPTGVDARIKANIEAIKTLKRLQASGEAATADDMALLRAFSGWGGLGKAFNDYNYRYTLRELLGAEQFDEFAQMSRNSAYFTPAKIIDTMWDIARAFGFKGGRVLEGSAGVGNILGLMPKDLSRASSLHAVEIDPTTAGMLALLYPDAKVENQGFEATKIDNNSVDLAITNVPFVSGLRFNDTSGDRDLSRKFPDIHNFCIAKNVRKLREGGIGIFITTSGTLDGCPKLFEWMNTDGNADVVGVFRLNNQTFGGTPVTSDIIVVRKRVDGAKSPHAIDVSKNTGVRSVECKDINDRGQTVTRQRSVSYNRYFVEHPEHMGGEMFLGYEKGDTYRPTSIGLYPTEGKQQDKLLSAWLKEMQSKGRQIQTDAPVPVEARRQYTPQYDKAAVEVKTGSLVVDSKGRLCVNYDGQLRPLMSAEDKAKPKTEDERIRLFNSHKVKGKTRAQVLSDYNALKKALDDVLSYQNEHADDTGLQPLLKTLNDLYDKFVNDYGYLNRNNQLAWLRNDVDFPSVLALETYREQGLEHTKVYGKSDVMRGRVIVPAQMPKPQNVADGVMLSIRRDGRLDLRYIADELNMDQEEVRRQVIDSGLGFVNPQNGTVEPAHQYLSGNVRQKLKQAEENNADGRYNANIAALRRVVPRDIPAHLIEFSIGSSWIDPALFEEYVRERTGAAVKLTYAVGRWTMNKPKSYHWTEQDRAYGVRSAIFDTTIPGHELIEAAMTNKTIRVTRTVKRDGREEVIVDRDATAMCGAKVDEIRDDFKSWLRNKLQADEKLRTDFGEAYNDAFNNSRPMEIPAEYIPEYFDGATRVINGKPVKLREHQAKAVVRATMQSLMLAHEVGTGKTFTLITSAMEMRRLGTANKPMIVVQNATIGQFVNEAKKLYPNARILSLEEADHSARGRKNFYAKIRSNDWDMVIIPQSTLDYIPDHPDRQRRFIEDSIQEKMEVIEAMKNDQNASATVATLKKEVENLHRDLAALGESTPKGKGKKKDEKKIAVQKNNAKVRAEEMLERDVDDTLNFDDLGIDAILVDEAHEYKHLGFATAMQRGIKGVDPSYSKKCQGLYLKIKAVQEKSGGRNVVFATGTPISNTAAEIWTFMRYLLPKEVMADANIWYFDDFVRNFGSIQQMLEFTTSGSFKEVNRFAGYTNLPELARIWSGIADTVLTAEAGEVRDKIPEIEGGAPKDVYLSQTQGLRSVLKYVRAELARYNEMSGAEKKANSHIPLTMYGIAKAAAIDPRLVSARAADEANSKTNEAVRQTLRSLSETADYKGAVVIFADNYQRKNKQTDRVEFNLFEDIRDKLIDAGVPPEQIVVMRDGMTDKRKAKIFAAVNAGEVRVILGTTQRLGVGVNIQERLHTLIHLDAPNRPMDYWQRMGRLLRQGNLHRDMGKPVRVLRFGVEDSLDVTAYQRLKTKGAIADAVMGSKRLLENNLENRVLEEAGDEFGNITAELSGSEYAMLLNQAEKELRKLEGAREQHRAHQTHIAHTLPKLEAKISEQRAAMDKHRAALEVLSQLKDTKISIQGKTFAGVDSMEKLFEAHNKSIAQRRTQAVMGQNTTSNLTFKVGGIEFTLKIEVTAESDIMQSSSRIHSSLSCDTLGIRQLDCGGRNLKAVMQMIVEDVMSGKFSRNGYSHTEAQLARAEADHATLSADRGKQFEHDGRIAELREKVNEYTEAMKAELAAKESKYAQMDAEVEVVDDISYTEADEEEDGDKPDTRGESFSLRSDDASAPRAELQRIQDERQAYIERKRQAIDSNPYGITNERQVGVGTAKRLFDDLNTNPVNARLMNRVAAIAERLGLKVAFVDYMPASKQGMYFTHGQVLLPLSMVYNPRGNATAHAILHELIHAVTVYALKAPRKALSPQMRRGVDILNKAYRRMAADPSFRRDYGALSVFEFVAELSNPGLRERLKQKSMWGRIKAAVMSLLGFKPSNVHDRAFKALNLILENFDQTAWSEFTQQAKRKVDNESVSSKADKKNTPVNGLPNRANEKQTSGSVLSRAIGNSSSNPYVPVKADTKIQNNTLSAKKKIRAYQNRDFAVDTSSFQSTMRDLGRLLNLENRGGSRYTVLQTDNGSTVCIRLSDHTANGNNFVRDKADRNLSLVIERKRYDTAPDSKIEFTEAVIPFEAYQNNPSAVVSAIVGGVENVLADRPFTLKSSIGSVVHIAKPDNPDDIFASADYYAAVARGERSGGVYHLNSTPDNTVSFPEIIGQLRDLINDQAKDAKNERQAAVDAIQSAIPSLRRAMSAQRRYDRATVKIMADLAKGLIDARLLDDLSRVETKRIISALQNGTSVENPEPHIQKLLDIMIDNQLRAQTRRFKQLASNRGKSVNAKGVEAQAGLDPAGQLTTATVRKWSSSPLEDIDERIQDCTNRMADKNNTIAEAATHEYAGLLLARQFVDTVKASKAEEESLRAEIARTKQEFEQGLIDRETKRQTVQAIEEAIRINKMERCSALENLSNQLTDILKESGERAQAWLDGEKQRVRDIHHNANSDLQGRSTREHIQPTTLQKWANNSIVQFFLQPLATFEQMMRMFGGNNANGEGYLYNRFVRQRELASENEYTGIRDAVDKLNTKVREIFGSKAKSWERLFGLERKLPGMILTFYDGGEMVDHNLSQGNLLYIYMCNKMLDGRMKLRRKALRLTPYTLSLPP